jgi:adenine phosphoribosyltransferase
MRKTSSRDRFPSNIERRETAGILHRNLIVQKNLELASRVRSAVRDIPDFPKPGILFKDITPVLADAALFRDVTDSMGAPFTDADVTHVVAIESRGFILGGPIAVRLHAGLVPVRKPGKLPAKTERIEYALEYGTDALEVHADAFGKGARVLVIDDVLATGGTAAATVALIRRLGAEVVGLSFLIELSFLSGTQRLRDARIESVVR